MDRLRHICIIDHFLLENVISGMSWQPVEEQYEREIDFIGSIPGGE